MTFSLFAVSFIIVFISFNINAFVAQNSTTETPTPTTDTITTTIYTTTTDASDTEDIPTSIDTTESNSNSTSVTGPNYFIDVYDEQGVLENIAFVPGVCSISSFSPSSSSSRRRKRNGVDYTYVLYTCNDDGSVTKTLYKDSSCSKRDTNYQITVFDTSASAGELYSYECNGYGSYIENSISLDDDCSVELSTVISTVNVCHKRADGFYTNSECTDNGLIINSYQATSNSCDGTPYTTTTINSTCGIFSKNDIVIYYSMMTHCTIESVSTDGASSSNDKKDDGPLTGGMIVLALVILICACCLCCFIYKRNKRIAKRHLVLTAQELDELEETQILVSTTQPNATAATDPGNVTIQPRNTADKPLRTVGEHEGL